LLSCSGDRGRRSRATQGAGLRPEETQHAYHRGEAGAARAVGVAPGAARAVGVGGGVAASAVGVAPGGRVQSNPGSTRRLRLLRRGGLVALWPYSHRPCPRMLRARRRSVLRIPWPVGAGCGGSLSGFPSGCVGTPGSGGCPTGLEGGKVGGRGTSARLSAEGFPV
jgi:hypothetical protein